MDDATENKERPGRILTETVFGSWCDICYDYLGDFPTYQEASIALTKHLDTKHSGWELKAELNR